MSTPASVTVPGQLELLPGDPPLWGGPAAVPSSLITTRGRTEQMVRCEGDDGCGAMHRHIGPGVRTGPCGASYTIPSPTTETEQES